MLCGASPVHHGADWRMQLVLHDVFLFIFAYASWTCSASPASAVAGVGLGSCHHKNHAHLRRIRKNACGGPADETLRAQAQPALNATIKTEMDF